VVQRGPEEVVVEVRGRAPQVVPGIAWGVTSRAAGPMERLVPDSERFRISEGSTDSNSRVGEP
jgi:hypothetical protein